MRVIMRATWRVNTTCKAATCSEHGPAPSTLPSSIRASSASSIGAEGGQAVVAPAAFAAMPRGVAPRGTPRPQQGDAAISIGSARHRIGGRALPARGAAVAAALGQAAAGQAAGWALPRSAGRPPAAKGAARARRGAAGGRRHQHGRQRGGARGGRSGSAVRHAASSSRSW